MAQIRPGQSASACYTGPLETGRLSLWIGGDAGGVRAAGGRLRSGGDRAAGGRLRSGMAAAEWGSAEGEAGAVRREDLRGTHRVRRKKFERAPDGLREPLEIMVPSTRRFLPVIAASTCFPQCICTGQDAMVD